MYINGFEVESIFVLDSNMKYEEFMKKLWKKFGMDKNNMELKVSYVPNREWIFPLVTMRSDECFTFYLYECWKQPYRILLCVELINKDGGDKGFEACKVEDNQIMSYENFRDNITMVVQECDVASMPRDTAVNDGCDVIESCLPTWPPQEGLKVLKFHKWVLFNNLAICSGGGRGGCDFYSTYFWGGRCGDGRW